MKWWEARPVRARRSGVEAAFFELRGFGEARELGQGLAVARVDQQGRRRGRPSGGNEDGEWRQMKLF